MDLKKFERVNAISDDCEACWQAMTDARVAISEIRDAVHSRIENESQHTKKRMIELERIIKDISRTETMREMARLELKKYRNISFEATPEERKTFNLKIEAAKKAITDFIKAKNELGNAYKDAEEELKSLRTKILNSQNRDAQLARRWIDSDLKSFERLILQIEE